MSYTPTQWQTGDTITAEKLNNMESGIENANDLASILPTVTASDNGKVLMVTNGRWAAGSIPSATGVSF